jgi:pimeloyl-ACP methyl ester carboxylesterase
MPSLTTAALALAALALAAVAHHAFWTSWFRVPAADDELLRPVTADGWRLCLGRCRPRGPARALPVLLVHGLAVNRQFMAFGARPHGMAEALSDAGFDCFSLDLRGHGGSRPGPSRDWCFDDYLREDLPAALDAVAQATGASRALLVGHSQGALLALAIAGLRPERVAGVVAMAGPTHMDVPPEMRFFARMAFRLRGLTRLMARMLAPFAGLLPGGPTEASIVAANCDRPVLRRMLSNTVENVATGVALQFRTWIREGVFRSADGAVDYRANLARPGPPALFVAGPRDGLAPPRVVRRGYEAWGGPKEWFLAGRESGLSTDYGHGDMIFGRRAPEEVLPRIREWLVAQDAKA